MKIGCHVSIAGGIANAPARARDLGCETFQIFTRSPQGGKAAPITKKVIADFGGQMHQFGFEDFVVHTPYYINFGSSAKNIYYGSIAVVKDELERANALGARFVMTHLGTFKDIGEEKGFEQVLEGLVKVLQGYTGHQTKFLLEIAAGAGSVIGSTFEQLAVFSRRLSRHKMFGGICFDTQHAFASGYAINSRAGIKKVFADFNSVVGLKYLRMSHVNDSKIEFGGKRDRHAHIGEGLIGEKGFTELLAFFKNLEKKSGQEMLLILETEHDKVQADIEKLKHLRSRLGIK